jgi:F-type H+-transporting ATPase subunit epsilon
MAMTMHVDIVSAEESIFSGIVEFLAAPALQGEVGIYPRHTQMLSPLRPGTVRITKPGGEEESFYVSGGVIEVQPDTVTVLSDTALRAHDIDEAAALEAKRHAEDALKDKQADIDYARAQVELAEAIAQLRVIETLRKKGMK